MTVSVYHAFSFAFIKYFIPFYLLTVSCLFSFKINFRFSLKDFIAGITVSIAVLFPFFYFMTFAGKTFTFLSVGSILFQLLAVSLPEEFYFRGFLQEIFGNTVRAVISVSALFSLMHLPQFIFYGDIYALLTFFPSLCMGFLYMRTSNVIPSIIFHFMANVIFSGFTV